MLEVLRKKWQALGFQLRSYGGISTQHAWNGDEPVAHDVSTLQTLMAVKGTFNDERGDDCEPETSVDAQLA